MIFEDVFGDDDIEEVNQKVDAVWYRVQRFVEELDPKYLHDPIFVSILKAVANRALDHNADMTKTIRRMSGGSRAAALKLVTDGLNPHAVRKYGPQIETAFDLAMAAANDGFEFEWPQE